jgi:hypothetical protein
VNEASETGVNAGRPLPPTQTRFKSGQSGNPGGKPVRARNAINAKFLNALLKEFDESGAKAIKRCAEEEPAAFVRVLASLQPKELEITRPLDDISDEQLDAAYLACRAILDAQSAGEGAGGEVEAQSAENVSAVSEAG